MLVKETNDKTIIIIKLMIQALLKQRNGKIEDARELWKFTRSNPNLPIHLQIYSLENSLKNNIILWKEKKELNLLEEIENIILVWEKLANDNFLMSSLATIYLLKAKFFIANLQIEKAKLFLENGIKIAEKYDLEVDEKDINRDKEKISKLEQLEQRTIIKKDIELIEMLDYLKNISINLKIER